MLFGMLFGSELADFLAAGGLMLAWLLWFGDGV